MSKNDRFTFLKSLNRKTRAYEGEMSFFDHLEELRWHIIRSLLAVAIIAGVAFSYPNFIFDTIIFGPKNVNFWTYRQLCHLAQILHKPDLCITKFDFVMMNQELAGQFTWLFTASIMSGIIVGFPYLLWELWRFISPALKPEERKHATGMIFFGSLLFLLGVLFGYYIVMPLTVNFLGGFTISKEILNQITLDSYISTLLTLSLTSGVTFEMPILAYYLAKIGIITRKMLREGRRYAIIVILLLAAVITPSSDIFTQLTVSAPLFVLFEISIVVVGRVEHGKRRAEKLLQQAENL